jgi:hypothetical protein
VVSKSKGQAIYENSDSGNHDTKSEPATPGESGRPRLSDDDIKCIVDLFRILLKWDEERRS